MITVLFTMKNDKCKVFFPAICTMAGLHLMSVGFGTIFPLLFSRNSIVYFSVVLFLFFGVMMIYEAYHLQPKLAEDKLKELNKDLLENKDPESTANPGEKSGLPSTSATPYAETAGKGKAQEYVSSPDNKLPVEENQEKEKEKSKYFCSNPYLQLVVLLFLADWGDRCQISAIVLTATHNVWGVAAGGAIV